MKTSILLILVLLTLTLSSSIFNKKKHITKHIIETFSNEKPKELFKIWHLVHQKGYVLSSEEAKTRFRIFKENMKKVKEHNSTPGVNYFLSLNAFADHSVKEFGDKFLMKPGRFQSSIESKLNHGFNKKFSLSENDSNDKKYETVNWIKTKAFSNVYDQGKCGSCWAFSTAQTLEWMNYIKTGKEIPLSKQQLVDCDKQSDGCDGGLPHTALEYIKANGLQYESDYEYKGVNGVCHYDSQKNQVRIKNFRRCIGGNCQTDNDLHRTLKRGPVTVVVDASDDFMLYDHGIYDKNCKEANHAVLLVGHETSQEDPNKAYWIVKNSWTERWGDHGYIRIKHDENYNSCLMNTYFTQPIIKK